VRNRELAKLIDDPASDYFMPNPKAKRSVLEDRDEYTAEGVFWIPEGHRWDDLRKAAKQPDIGKRVNAAMDAIERDNPTLKGVLPKEYARQELTAETVGGIIDTFSRQDLAAQEYQGLDVLGRVYEYFLGQFASNEGKKAGEFGHRPASQRHAGIAGWGAGQGLDLGDLGRGEHRWPSGPGPVVEPVEPMVVEPFAPLADGVEMHPGLGGDPGVGVAVGGGQHDLGADQHPMLGPTGTDPG